MTLGFRDAQPGDESRAACVVRWVAEAEGLTHRLTATESHYARLMFGARAMLHGLLMERNGELLGGALWALTAGTFSGNPGMFVEDVAVAPTQRGRGLGHVLFAALAQRAHQEGCDRMDWRVHRDNAAAIGFYEALKALPQRDTTYMRIEGASLTALAASHSGA